MATQQPAQPPTEAEIRAAVQRAVELPDLFSEVDLGPMVYELVRPLRYAAPEDRPTDYPLGLWDDLRPSQETRLTDLADRVYEKADLLLPELAARISEYVVEAALTFAQEHPDAPRAIGRPVPA